MHTICLLFLVVSSGYLLYLFRQLNLPLSSSFRLLSKMLVVNAFFFNKYGRRFFVGTAPTFSLGTLTVTPKFRACSLAIATFCRTFRSTSVKCNKLVSCSTTCLPVTLFHTQLPCNQIMEIYQFIWTKKEKLLLGK